MYLRSLTVALAALMCNVCVYAGADTTRSEIEKKEAYWAATLASGDIAALSAFEHGQGQHPGQCSGTSSREIFDPCCRRHVRKAQLVSAPSRSFAAVEVEGLSRSV
jgi:hypothetical protein